MTFKIKTVNIYNEYLKGGWQNSGLKTADDEAGELRTLPSVAFHISLT